MQRTPSLIRGLVILLWLFVSSILHVDTCFKQRLLHPLVIEPELDPNLPQGFTFFMESDSP